MRGYRPEELFDENGTLVPELRELPPRGERRMSASPHANGGLLLRGLRLPDFRQYALNASAPGAVSGEATRELGKYLRDVMKLNEKQAPAISWCIASGSSPSTKCGSCPYPRSSASSSWRGMRASTVGLLIL